LLQKESIRAHKKHYLFVTSRTGNINSQTLFLEGKSPIPSLTERYDKKDGKAADDFEARVISCLTTPTRKLSGVFRLCRGERYNFRSYLIFVVYIVFHLKL